MRWLIIASILLTQVTLAYANCQVFVPVKEFYNSGYVINFDFTKMLSEKNYKEVYSASEADFELKLEGIEQEGRLHKAVAILEMGAYKAQESVTCYTQYCGVSDYGKAFSRSYKKLSKLIPACN
ncbi:MAG: hypothetical protein H0V66_04940 [Bdellovibrionales bacterium]|nr:hypothetical protein [Bdellovibrionales bacterium]